MPRGLRVPFGGIELYLDPDQLFRHRQAAVLLVVGRQADRQRLLDALPGEVTYDDGTPPVPIAKINVLVNGTGDQAEAAIRTSLHTRTMGVIGLPDDGRGYLSTQMTTATIVI